MGLKGISWIEQNIEKVVVGIFGVALLGAVALQFVGEGSTIEIGTGRDKKRYGYDQVWDQVLQQARATKAQVTSVEPDMSDLPETPAVLAGFTSKLRGPVSPSQTNLAAGWDRPTLEPYGLVGSGGAGIKTETYAAITPPAPSKPVGASYLGTIHPEEVRTHEGLAQLVGAKFDPEKPDSFKPGEILPKLDRAAISVETTFSGTDLEAVLLADPDADGPASPLPRHWWDSGNIQILGLELERQELGPDGEWGRPTKVAPMPGRLDLLATVNEAVEAEDPQWFREILIAASRQTEDVLRPPYYAVVLGEEWVPPSEVVDEMASTDTASVGGDRVTRLKREYDIQTRDLASLDQRIKALEEEVNQGSGGRRPTAQPPGGGGKGGGPPRDVRQPDQTTRDPKQARLDSMRRTYAARYAKRERIAEELRALGAEVPGQAVPVATPQAPKPRETEPPLLLNPEVRLWAHDVTVERGKTYRYRVTVVLNNPLYNKQAALDEKQHSLAETPLVRSAPSEWSDPVRVDPETFYFITSASPEDAFASAARASAEVFVFSMGYWRKGQVNLEPGDTIAADVRVPDPEKIVALIASDPNQITQPTMPSPSRPDGPQLVEPGRGLPRGVPPGPEGGRPYLPPVQQPGVQEPQEIDPATILIPRLVTEDAMLLDVASTTVVSEGTIAKTKTENQAYLLNEEGRIVVRTPDGDRSAAAYLRLVRSAERGEEAMRPRVLLEKPRLPTTTAPEPSVPRPTDGGGGGGGG